jgi:hypothetical protein
MTTNLDPHLMPAQNTTKPTPATPTGEGVKAVALFESRKGRGTRAWDELSEIDRQVLLESMRQRRKYQAHKTKIYSELYGMRTNK